MHTSLHAGILKKWGRRENGATTGARFPEFEAFSLGIVHHLVNVGRVAVLADVDPVELRDAPPEFRVEIRPVVVPANHLGRRRRPRSDVRITFVEAVANGSDRVEAVTEARCAAHARTSSQQRELWVYYSSMADSMATLETKAEDKGVRNESRTIGQINSSGQMEDGYTFQTNATANITTSNGCQITVPAATKIGNTSKTINPLTDDLLVTVFNPETGQSPTIINTGEFEYYWEGDAEVQQTWNPSSQTAIYGMPYTTTSRVDVEYNLNGDGNTALLINGTGHNIRINYEHGVEVMDGLSADTELPEAGEFSLRETPSGVEIWVNNTKQTTLSGELRGLELDGPETRSVQIDTITEYTGTAMQTSYTNQFASKHTELEAIDDDVISGLGTSSFGYLSDVYDAYQGGEINITDSLWQYDRVRMAPDEMASTATQNLARERLGLGRSDSGASASVTVHEGAVVNGETLEENTTYDAATLWATSPPPNAS